MSEFNSLSNSLITSIRKSGKLYYLSTRKDEISIRCVYCGDSLKSERSAHLYIELVSPYRFHCKKCNEDGLVTPKFLRDLDLMDSDLIYEVQRSNLKSKKEFNLIKKSSNFKNKKLKLEYTESSSELKKLNYVNKRLNLKLDFEDALNYKMVLNFKKLIEDNNVSIHPLNEWMIKRLRLLNSNYVGFLSHNDSCINFRNINEDNNDRYTNFTLDNLNRSKFYIKPTTIDILKEEIKLTICEGIFDLISIDKNYLRKDNDILVSVNGSSYDLVINHLQKLGFLNLDIEIFSDNDVPIEYFKKIKRNNILLSNKKIKINYNNIGKDFGVVKNKIERIYNNI